MAEPFNCCKLFCCYKYKKSNIICDTRYKIFLQILIYPILIYFLSLGLGLGLIGIFNPTINLYTGYCQNSTCNFPEPFDPDKTACYFDGGQHFFWDCFYTGLLVFFGLFVCVCFLGILIFVVVNIIRHYIDKAREQYVAEQMADKPIA